VSTDPCGHREFCEDGGCRDLQWVCDLWRDCSRDGDDNCNTPLFPHPGEEPAPGTLSRVHFPTHVLTGGYRWAGSDSGHFTKSVLGDTPLVGAWYLMPPQRDMGLQLATLSHTQSLSTAYLKMKVRFLHRAGGFSQMPKWPLPCSCPTFPGSKAVPT
jgi:hypothetical protein